jgi:hypothetical protein
MDLAWWNELPAGLTAAEVERRLQELCAVVRAHGGAPELVIEWWAPVLSGIVLTGMPLYVAFHVWGDPDMLPECGAREPGLRFWRWRDHSVVSDRDVVVSVNNG